MTLLQDKTENIFGCGLLILLLMILFNACSETTDKISDRTGYPFPYDLENPERKFKLSDKLKEISGLCEGPDGRLAAVQDEKGMIYFIDPDSGEVIGSIPFEEPGDYEGITFDGIHFWVVRSDGILFRIKDETDIRKFSTGISKDADIEGICMSRDNKRLVLSAKKGTVNITKDIYYIDPEDPEKDLATAFSLPGNEILKMAPDNEKSFHFQPSGIDIHPESGNMYILSAFDPALLVVGAKGNLLYLDVLDKKKFPQPEAICFDKKGGLWIASEGVKKKARLYRFVPVNNKKIKQ